MNLSPSRAILTARGDASPRGSLNCKSNETRFDVRYWHLADIGCPSVIPSWTATMPSREPGADMRRREFIGLLGGAVVVWPLTSGAQQQPVLGILHSQTPESEASRMVSILQGLREAGIDPSRLTIEHRYAEGRNDRLPALAAELVQ